MLEPSNNFSANELRFLQNEANEWIEYVNKKMIEAASNGQEEVNINITPNDKIGEKYWNAPNSLIQHFIIRGFEHIPNGQSSVKFKWSV